MPVPEPAFRVSQPTASRIPPAAIACAIAVLLSGPAEAKPWSIEVENSVELNTNLMQQAGGAPDFALRNRAAFSYAPLADGENSALFSLQALDQRYLFNPAFNSTLLIGSAVASRRLFDNWFCYAGYQGLYRQANAIGGVNRTDHDAFGGIVVYRQLAPTQLAFHGYQYDLMRAEVTEQRYQGHSIYASWRDFTAPRWTNTLSGRTQLRMFYETNILEWRNYLILESDYRFTDWFGLRGEVIAMNATSSLPIYSFWSLNFGTFTHFVF